MLPCSGYKLNLGIFILQVALSPTPKLRRRVTGGTWFKWALAFSGLATIVVNPSRVTNEAYLCIGQHVSAVVTVILADVLVTVFNWLRGNEPVHEATSDLDLSGHVQA